MPPRPDIEAQAVSSPARRADTIAHGSGSGRLRHRLWLVPLLGSPPNHNLTPKVRQRSAGIMVGNTVKTQQHNKALGGR
jgi:hypothetical protein